MNVPEGYVLIETPPEDEPLVAGDRLELTWDIYQTGTWYWSQLMIPRVEQAFERDGRIRLNGYVYDPERMTITYQVEVLSNNVAQTSTPALAASLGPIALVAFVTIGFIVSIIVGAVLSAMYQKYRVEVARKSPKVQEMLESPETDPEVKVVLEEGIKRQTGPGVLETISETSGALGLLALAIIAVVVIGALK